MANNTAAQDVVSELSYNDQLSIFGEPVAMDTEESAKAYNTLKFLTQQYESRLKRLKRLLATHRSNRKRIAELKSSFPGVALS